MFFLFDFIAENGEFPAQIIAVIRPISPPPPKSGFLLEKGEIQRKSPEDLLFQPKNK